MQGLANKRVSIWRNSTFVRMFVAYSLSMMGQWFDAIAMVILFNYIWQADPMLVSLIPVAYAIPHVVFGQMAGIYSDRWDKLRLMIGSDLAAAVLTVVLIFAPNPRWALFILFLRATAEVVNFPAQQALVRHVVHKDLLLKAVSLNGTMNQLSKIVGPFLGASLVAIASPKAALVVNVIAFFISAAILSTIGKIKETGDGIDVENEEARENRVTLFNSWNEGWTIVLKNRLLWASLLFNLVGFVATQLVDPQFGVLFREKAPDRPELIGWVASAFGLGGLCMILILNRKDTIKSYGSILGGSVLLIGISFYWLGNFQMGMSGWIPLLGAFVGGVGVGLFTVGTNFLLQKETPKNAVGRVSGIFNSLMSAILIFAPITGGILVKTVGVSEAFRIVGIFVGVVGLVGILLQKWIWGSNKKPANQTSAEL